LKLTKPRSKTIQKTRKLSVHSWKLRKRQGSKFKRREKSKSIFSIKKDKDQAKTAEENLKRRKSLHYRECNLIFTQ